MRNQKLNLVSAAVLATLSLTNLHAAGFSLYGEANAVATGNYGAGAAAEVSDASIGWYNPAGLALIHDTQVVGAGVGLFLTNHIDGSTAFTTLVPKGTFRENFYGLSGAKDGLVPAFHIAKPINDKLTLGFSVVSPFGLATEWPFESPVRYQATESELLTVTASPEFGYRVHEHAAIGAGIDITYAEVRFNSIVGIPTLATVFHQPANFFDTYSYNKGDSVGVGFHVGGLLMFNDNHTRLGLNFQSQTRQTFEGESRFVGRLASPGLTLTNPLSVFLSNPNAVFSNNDLQSDPINFPFLITLSGYHDVTDRIAILGSAVYTGWDSFSAIQLNNVAAFSPTLGLVPVVSHSDENWKNVWRLAVGANVKVMDQMMLRFGVGYDQTPTVTERRSVRIADTDRVAVAVGSRFFIRPDIDIDVGYTHIFNADDIQIQRTDIIGTSAFTVNATGRSTADLVGAQVTWHFDGRAPEAPMKA